jgi:hypothetical protein
VRPHLGGIAAVVLMTLLTALWVFWGVAEMYWEAWWGPWRLRLAYMVPGATCFLLLLVSLAWPRMGGWLVIAVGAGFSLWWTGLQAARGLLNFASLFGMFLASGQMIVIGLLFLRDATERRRLRAAGWTPPVRAWLRHLRWIVGIGVQVLMVMAVSAFWAPILLTRTDDGRRDARLIEGNGVRLVWAPEGPGWARGSHYDDPFGRARPGDHPSWNMIAAYAVPPRGLNRKPGWDRRHATAADMRATGLCRYLTPDGHALAAEPQDVWRMPTVNEITRSLGRHGVHAGCTWSGRYGQQPCRVTPDKETPLWVPGWSPIYLWAADAEGDRALYVGYNGMVQPQPKSWGNPRHGFRCVRQP